MRMRALQLALGALCLMAPSAAAQSAKDVYRRIEQSKPSVDPRLFKELTSYGDTESLKLIQRTLNLYQAGGTLRHVYVAFENYRAGPLEGEAIALSGSLAPRRRTRADA